MSISEIIRDNFKTIVALGGGYIAAAEFGYVQYPEISAPTGWGLVVTAGILIAIGAYYYADRILDLLPDDEGIYLFAFETHDESGGRLYELTEDQFSDMRVVNGTLFQWSGTSKRVYEVRHYHEDRNVAVANWRESVAGSQFAGDATVAEAMEFIREIREVFEPESEKFRRLQRRLRGVARELDRQRLEDQQRILDDNLAPNFTADDDSGTIEGVLREQIEDELLPESMTGEDDERLSSHHSAANGNGHDDEGEYVPFDVLDENEAIEPGGSE